MPSPLFFSIFIPRPPRGLSAPRDFLPFPPCFPSSSYSPFSHPIPLFQKERERQRHNNILALPGSNSMAVHYRLTLSGFCLMEAFRVLMALD